MDERVLERMLRRSCSAICSTNSLVLSFFGLFLSSVFWVCLRAALGGIGGVFRLPLFIVSASFAVLPLAPVIPPLMHSYLVSRLGANTIPLHWAIQQWWKQSLVLFLYALSVAFVELVLALVVALWYGFEAIPVFGVLFYLFLSWVPALVAMLMVVLFCVHICLLLVGGSSVAKTTVVGPKRIFDEIVGVVEGGWIIRCKTLVLGLAPSLLLCVASSFWETKGLTHGAEFVAALFRLGVFSVVEAPAFLFLLYMAVEVDRYLRWLSSRR